MGTSTKIHWTEIIPGVAGATWNPIQAHNKETHKRGWACVRVSPGCENCYAEHQNMTAIHGMGTGLGYTVPNLQKIEMELSLSNGQTGLDWPLRSKKSVGIFPCSMTDWLGAEFVPIAWSNQMLTVMCLAQQHIFMTLTKRWERLEKMLTYFTDMSKGMEAPDNKIFDTAIIKAMGNFNTHWKGGLNRLEIRNANYSANIPWPPPNIFFGISVCTEKEAEKALPILQRIKALSPAFKLWISYEPALEIVDWKRLGYTNELSWNIVGGESGKEARNMPFDCVYNTIEWGKNNNTPVYVKQMGSVWAKENNADSHGINVPEEFAVRQFPDISKSYIPWR